MVGGAMMAGRGIQLIEVQIEFLSRVERVLRVGGAGDGCAVKARQPGSGVVV